MPQVPGGVPIGNAESANAETTTPRRSEARRASYEFELQRRGAAAITCEARDEVRSVETIGGSHR